MNHTLINLIESH